MPLYFSDHFDSTKVRLLFAEVICITIWEDKHIEVERHLSHVSEAGIIARFIRPSQKAITYILQTQEIIEILFYILDSLFEILEPKMNEIIDVINQTGSTLKAGELHCEVRILD